MKFTIGLLIIIAGWLMAIYVGLWLLFIGGIIQVIEGAKVDPVSSYDIAVGICKFMFAGSAAIFGWVGTILGGLIMSDTNTTYSRKWSWRL